MSFETAKFVSMLFHYVIAVSAAMAFILWKPNIRRAFYRTYIVLFFWVALTYFFDGCFLTYWQNQLSRLWYGREFYPNYGFQQTDAFVFLQHWDLLIPLFIVLLCEFLDINLGSRQRY